MRKFAVGAVAAAAVALAAPSTALAHGGGHYPVQKPMVAVWPAPIKAGESTNVFASKFCPWGRMTIKFTGPQRFTKTTRTDSEGKAWARVKLNKAGVYNIQATACGKSAFTRITVRSKHKYHRAGEVDETLIASFDDLSTGMSARANGITDIGSGIGIPLVSDSSSDDASSIRMQQTVLVAGAAAAGLGGVTVIRRRGRRAAA
ncbi:MAG: hypothetical protein AB7N61_25805 [Acidimicrobiia bacterium]